MTKLLIDETNDKALPVKFKTPQSVAVVSTPPPPSVIKIGHDLTTSYDALPNLELESGYLYDGLLTYSYLSGSNLFSEAESFAVVAVSSDTFIISAEETIGAVDMKKVPAKTGVAAHSVAKGSLPIKFIATSNRFLTGAAYYADTPTTENTQRVRLRLSFTGTKTPI